MSDASRSIAIPNFHAHRPIRVCVARFAHVLIGLSEPELLVALATPRRHLELFQRLLLVDRLVELALLVGDFESALREAVATPRQLLVPHERRLRIDRRI